MVVALINELTAYAQARREGPEKPSSTMQDNGFYL
jgi:hypothetical protein